MNAALNQLLALFARLSPRTALGWIVVENLLIFFGVLLFGHLLIRRFERYRVTPPAPPVERLEIILSSLVVVINCLVTYAGWLLWRRDILVIAPAGSLFRTLGDALALLLLMDLVMYALHRAAHHPTLFRYLHALHHRYDHPRPLTLFVMNPLEALMFGALWLFILRLHPWSFSGITLYLTLNAAMGMVGHLGVEVLPAAWTRNRFIRCWGGSAFHAGHHVEGGTNFGFYTTLWDHLFGTLAAAQK